MNYKIFFKSRDLRIKILSLLNWIPDRIMISLQYRIHTGRKLNLKDPQRFTEKLQLYKLKFRNPDMLKCTDKYEVRDYVEKKGFKDILIPLFGIYDNASQIDFDKLPDQFVAKTTDGGGGNQVYLCRNKKDLKKDEFFNILNKWMKDPKPKKSAGREWAYENGYPRRILIEEFLSDNKHKDIQDYKFWCFNGKPKFCQVIGNRSSNETIDFFDMEWNHLPFVGLNPACKNEHRSIEKPNNFDEMKQIASKLSANFPFVRVDLYNTGKKQYFGELTFYPASGYGKFTPDEWDNRLGELFSLEK